MTEDVGGTAATPTRSPAQYGRTPEPDSARSRGWWAAIAAVLVVVTAAGGLVLLRDDPNNEGTDGPAKLALFSVDGAEMSSADAAPDGGPEVRIEGSLPELGSSGTVYRLERPALDSGRVETMAAAMGIEGSAVEAGGAWRVESAGGGISVEPTPGGWSVGAYGDSGIFASVDPSSGTSPETANTTLTVITPDGDTWVEGPPTPAPTQPDPPANLPSPEEAEAIALDLIETLVPGSEWTAEVTDGPTAFAAVGCAADMPCNAPADSPVLSRSVMLTRMLEGLPVSGLDWVVTVGDAGVVESAYGTLTDLQPIGDYPLRSTDEVGDDLENGKGFLGPMAYSSGVAVMDPPAPDAGVADTTVAPPVAATEIVVTDVTPSLVLVGGMEDGAEVAYVVPAYHFLGTWPDGTQWSTDMVALSEDVVEAADVGGNQGIEPGPPVSAMPEPAPTEPEPEVTVVDPPVTVPATTTTDR